MNKLDFSQRKTFPGTFEGSFDIALRAADKMDRLPASVFSVLLLGMALIPLHLHWRQSLALWGFFLVDWELLLALPKAGKSFGPSKPPTLLLALLRLPFAFLPLPWLWPLQGLGTVLVIYAFWIEPHTLTRECQQRNGPIRPPSKVCIHREFPLAF